MPHSIRKHGRVLAITLSGDQMVNGAAELYKCIVEQVDTETAVVVDAAGVTRLDTSVAQLFLILSRCVRELRVESASEVWSRTWEVLGFHRAVNTSDGRQGRRQCDASSSCGR